MKFWKRVDILLPVMYGLWCIIVVSNCMTYLYRELFTNGSIPYVQFNYTQVIENVLTGYILPKPKDCPIEIYDIMKSCWQFKAKERPTFSRLCDSLGKLFIRQELVAPLQEVVQETIYQ